MSHRKANRDDWKKRLEDRSKSISSNSLNIETILNRKESEKQKNKPRKNKVKKNIRRIDFDRFDKIENIIGIGDKNIFCEDGTVNTVNRDYSDIASILLNVKNKAGIYFVFCWPYHLEWLSLLQFLVNQQLAAKNHAESGYRLGIYPALPNSLGRGKQCRIDRHVFINRALEKVNSGEALDDVNKTYLALNNFNQYEDANERQHPCIKDITPSFTFDVDHNGWTLCGDGYFADIYKYIYRAHGKHRREDISKASEVLNSVKDTPGGVFLLPSRVKPKSVLDVLKQGGGVDTVIFDAREKQLSNSEFNRSFHVKLFESWVKSPDKPPLIVMIDNAVTLSRFRYDLFSIYKKQRVKNSFSNEFYQYALFKDSTDIWQTSQLEKSQNNKSQYCAPSIEVMGLAHAATIEKLLDIAMSTSSYEPKLSHEMRKAVGFLHRIAYFPVSQKELQEWVDNISKGWPEEEAVSLSRKYLWKSYVRQWRHKVSGCSSVVSIDRFLKSCESIYTLIENTTEAREALRNLFNRWCNIGGRKIILAPEKRSKMFILDMISNFNSTSSIHDIEVVTFREKANLTAYECIAVMNLNHSQLKDLLLKYGNYRKNCTVFVSAYSALRLQHEIKFLKTIPAYECIKPWSEDIDSQIKDITGSIKNVGKILSPFSGVIKDETYENGYVTGDSDHYSTIHLSTYGSLDVAKHTTIIKLKYAQGKAYQAVTVDELEEGDQIIIVDENLTNFVAEVLENIQSDAASEMKILKSYFSVAKSSIEYKYPQKTRKQRAQNILATMRVIDGELASDITQNMIERWIKNIETIDVNDVEISTQSARNKQHFLLFSQAINLDTSVATMFWQQGIKQYRTNNIQEGRRLANHVRHLLIGTLDYSLLGLSEIDFEGLKDAAKNNQFTVEMIIVTQ